MTSATSSVRLVIYASYSEYGVRTEDVAVVLETFPFKHKGFFSIQNKKICVSMSISKVGFPAST